MSNVVPTIPGVALGIPDREVYGDPSVFTPDQWITYLHGLHVSRGAGRHYDIRLGTEETDLLSWAAKKAPPALPQEKILAIQQPIHDYTYKDFFGKIPKGYGAGVVYPTEQHPALVLDSSSKHLTFTVDYGSFARRFRLQHLGGRKWLLINITPTAELPAKPKYKLLDDDEAKELITEVGGKIFSVQPKIDGALVFVTLNDKVEIFSHRISTRTGLPIFHTERVLGADYKVTIPKEYKGSILVGELYGVQKTPKGERILTPIELSAILNSGLYKARERLQKLGIQLRIYLFDVAKRGKEALKDDWYDSTVYPERRKFLDKVVKYLPSNFHVPIDEALTEQDARQLLLNIQKGMHTLTREGIVFHPTLGVPFKYKLLQEDNYYIVGFTPGQGKYKDAIGGILISDKPGGKPIAVVGTGLTDELRYELAKNKEAYLGRRVRVAYQEKTPKGSLRAPRLVAIEEEGNEIIKKALRCVLGGIGVATQRY